MFSWRLKVMVALSALALLAVAGGGVAPGGRAEPALTRSNSVLPPRTLVLCRRGVCRPAFYPLGLRGLARDAGGCGR